MELCGRTKSVGNAWADLRENQPRPIGQETPENTKGIVDRILGKVGDWGSAYPPLEKNMLVGMKKRLIKILQS